MNSPHAECRDGAIFWRGSDQWFRYMEPETARALLARRELPAAMLRDLAKAMAEQEESLIEQGVYHELA